MNQPSSRFLRSSASRRTFLQAGAGAVAVAFAGCVGGGPADSTTETTTGTTTGSTPIGTATTKDDPETSTTEETTTEDSNLPEHVAWRLELDGEVRLGPAVLGNALYVGDSTGVLRALDPGDGTERWRFETAGSFFSGSGADYSPLLVDDTLYAVSGNQSGPHGEGFTVYTLDAATGEKQWSVEQSSPKFLSLFGVAGGRVFVGTSDDALSGRGETLRALDSATGEVVWTAEIGDSRGAAVTEDAVYVTSGSRLDAFDAADGSRRFTRELPGRTLGPAVGGIDDGVVYVGFRDGRESGALALDPSSGETRWRVEGWFVTSMLTGEDGEGKEDESLYLGGERVAAFAPDGTERWRYDAGGLLSEGALVGDSLYVGGDPVTALSTDDGTARWSNPVDAEFGVVEGADEQVVAVQRGNSTVLDAFDAETGNLQFTFDVGGKWLSSVDAHAGTVYAGSDAGILYALRTD